MVFHVRLLCVLFLFVIVSAIPVAFQTAQGADPPPAAKAILVLDASGSMWGRIKGRTKIKIAREVIGSLVSNIDPNVHLGLTVYGHRRKGDCSDIQHLIAPGPVNSSSFIKTVNKLKPKGKTPLSGAVRQAAEELRYTEDPATVILVSDGIETCNADPCAVAKSLEESGVNFLLHVVGFGLKPSQTRALKCMAEATGGKYFSANDAGSLSSALGEAVKSAAANTRGNIFVYPVLGPGGPRVDEGVFWSAKQIDGQEGAEPIEIKDELGTKLVEVLPPGTYTISGKAKHTAGKAEIVVEDGGPTEFDLPLNAGAINLFVFEEEGKPFEKLEQLRKSMVPLDATGAPVKGKEILLSSTQNPIVVPPGRYLVTASATPIKVSKEVDLKLGEIIDVDLLLASGILKAKLMAAPGKPLKAKGNVWVKVRALDASGKPKKKGPSGVYNSGIGAIPTFRLAPGGYRVSSKLGAVTAREDIAIAAGEKQMLELVMASGRVRLTAVDANGNKRFCNGKNLWWSIYPVGGDGKPSTERVGLKSGISKSFVLPPGRYKARGSCDPDLGTAIFDVAIGQQNDLTVKVVPKKK